MHWADEMVTQERGWAGQVVEEGCLSMRGEDSRTVCLSVRKLSQQQFDLILVAEPAEHTTHFAALSAKAEKNSSCQ